MAAPDQGGGVASLANVRSPTFMLFLLVLTALTVLDFCGSGTKSGSVHASPDVKEVPKPRYASMMAGPTIRFLYW